MVDSLKECQRKHSQTTCSPRAEGLASLQAHLHTIPQLFTGQPRRQSGGKGGRRETRGRRVPRQREPACYVMTVSMMKVMTSQRNNERQGEVQDLLPVCRVYSLCKRADHIFATVHLYHSKISCQGLLGYNDCPTCPLP